MAVFNSKIAKQFDMPQTCSFCGGDEVHVFWYGGENVRACRSCAENVFPQLQADSVVGDRKFPALENSIELFLERAKANFYQACVKSLLRANNEK